jgi:hypothetical protein
VELQPVVGRLRLTVLDNFRKFGQKGAPNPWHLRKNISRDAEHVTIPLNFVDCDEILKGGRPAMRKGKGGEIREAGDGKQG